VAIESWSDTYINGKRYLVIEIAQLRIPYDWDPSSNVFLAVAAPTGGVFNYPALVRGDDGATPDIDTAINFTALAWDSATPEYASFSETSPGVFKLNLGLKRGAPGANGDTVLNAADFDNAAPHKMIVLDSSGENFVLQTQKVGNFYYPALVNNIPDGNPKYTICAISVPGQDFAWRPEVSGQQLLQGTGADVAVDLLARLNDPIAGNIVGRAIGQAGQYPATHVLSSGAPWDLHNDAYDRVDPGADTVIYVRAERRTGTETFSGSASNAFFKVSVCPIP
jgi:hypothetical protein